MLGINCEESLRELKECQISNKVASCFLCSKMMDCEKKKSFGELVMKNLNIKTNALRECQNEHKTLSCVACEKFLNCAIRNAYVDAVYLSMNKGNGGSFEF